MECYQTAIYPGKKRIPPSKSLPYRLVREAAVKDYAEIARLTGLTRARVTQLVNLLLLAPEIQAAILGLPYRSGLTERHLRPLISYSGWRCQHERWESLMGRHS